MNPHGLGIWLFYLLLLMVVVLTIWAVVYTIKNSPTPRRCRLRFRYKVGRIGN